MEIQEVFEDLMSRFIINVPEQEIATTDRICFQIEQAHWYYEDFLRESDNKLPGFSLKRFAAEMFERCPLLTTFLAGTSVEDIYQRFVAYKINIPVCGSIILNDRLDKVLLVRGWNARSAWTFPKGKINQDESEKHCAIRETMEEIGFDISPFIRDDQFIEALLRGEQKNRLYVIPDIPEATEFVTQTRKEIGDIRWHKISDLPRYSGKNRTSNAGQVDESKYYMIKRFVGDILRWISTYKKQKKRSRGKSVDTALTNTPAADHSDHLKKLLGITHSHSEHIQIQPAHSFSSTSPRNSSLPQPMTDKQSSLLSILKGIPSTASIPEKEPIVISGFASASTVTSSTSNSNPTPAADLLTILKGGPLNSSSASLNPPSMVPSERAQVSIPSRTESALIPSTSAELKPVAGKGQSKNRKQSPKKSKEANPSITKKSALPKKITILKREQPSSSASVTEESSLSPHQEPSIPIPIMKSHESSTSFKLLDGEITSNTSALAGENENMAEFKFNVPDIMKLFHR